MASWRSTGLITGLLLPSNLRLFHKHPLFSSYCPSPFTSSSTWNWLTTPGAADTSSRTPARFPRWPFTRPLVLLQRWHINVLEGRSYGCGNILQGRRRLERPPHCKHYRMYKCGGREKKKKDKTHWGHFEESKTETQANISNPTWKLF